jgi:hypothetical protein
MKDGREKVGDAAGAHKIDAAGPMLPKIRRLTLPFGPPTPETSSDGKRCSRRNFERSTVYEHYIREIPLAGGGLGCALWDGGLVLARWVFKNGPRVFLNRTVLELGCGVGLAGILAAHWASSVVLTDYIQETVDNALYNAKINCGKGADSGSDPDADGFVWDISSRVSARMLDWDRELALAADADGSGVSSAADDDALPCTVEGSPYSLVQSWLWCRTCWPADDSCGVCVPCSRRCHLTHDLVPQEAAKFRCDCRKRSGVSCSALSPPPPIAPVDIIIGSELTYNLLSTKSLAFVVNKYLRPGGVFYEVLSDDRDGVTEFADLMLGLGFTMVKVAAGGEFVGSFGTRKWSKQDSETYSFYTWRKPWRGDALAEAPDPPYLPDMEA